MLEKKLTEYSKSHIYPFHMPGHKRQSITELDAYGIDITEIDGFDNLHDAEGILLEARQRAARLYGVEESFYLVNGSTCGLLAAVSAACPRGGRLLVARNCHKAVYHAIALWGLHVDYLYPKMLDCGILGDITGDMVEDMCKQNHYDAVLITSPTYDGVISNIAEIAEIVHGYDIPLIVDEAHGAHLSLSDYFPKSAVEFGADLVVQSMHKTLPSLTMTSLLHRCSDRVSGKEIEHYLNFYETSSPSYVLMAGMDACIGFLETEGKQRFQEYYERLSDFYERSQDLQILRVIRPEEVAEEAYAFDAGKILISTMDANISGKTLYQLLLEKYELQMEMCQADYVLAMTSIMDTKEGFDRLLAALYEIDASISYGDGLVMDNIYTKSQPVMTIMDAEEAARKATDYVDLANAKGRIAADYIYMYPPGIPLLVPGEQILAKTIEDITSYQAYGFTVHNLSPDGKLPVIDEK